MSDWSDRYLRLLGVEAEPPSLDWISRFGAAHLRVVPFCNVTSIKRRHGTTAEKVPAIDRDAQLRAWEQRVGGGVCYEVAEMVTTLLQDLGYETHVVAGQITFPGSHQAVVVRLREGPYMIDLGCGAPLPDPIPLIRESEYHVAGLGYRFRPDLASMTCVQDRFIDGVWTEFCHYDLRPATDEDREAGFQRHHIPGETWVVGSITLVRYFDADGEVVSLRDGRLTRYNGAGKESISVATDADYEQRISEELRWPEMPVAEALAALRDLGV